MELGTALGLGSFVAGLFGSYQTKKMYEHREGMYQMQAEINRRIGQFNAMVAQQTGEDSISAIAMQTKKLMSQQINEFANRGVSLSGSPMFILGDTNSMGHEQAQEAYFNSQVKKVNYEYSAITAATTAEANAEQAQFGAYGSMLNTVKQLKSGYDLFKSMYNSSPLNTLSSPITASSPVGSSNERISSMMNWMMK